MVMLKSYNRANLTTPPLRTPINSAVRVTLWSRPRERPPAAPAGAAVAAASRAPQGEDHQGDARACARDL
eukprot:3627532-Prymnesium_polylepis.1